MTSEEIQGKIDSIVFSNRSTGFFILKVRLDGKNETVAVKGGFPGIPIGIGIKAKFVGTWIDHPSYGRQFQASVCDVVVEKGRNGIITYMSANVPSIGPVTAAKLYDALGDDLPNIIENDPDKIRELPFLHKNQSEALIKEWAVASENRTASIFLADLGLSSLQIRSVYTKFGGDTKKIVNENPYKLYECSSIGFSTADTVARKLGIGVDDPRRVRSMILFAMNEMSSSEGHMYCTSSQIQEFARKMFRRHSIEPFSHGDYISDSSFFQSILDLQKSEHIVSVNDLIYLDQHWDHESTSAECLSEMICQEPRHFGDLVQILSDFESKCGLTLSDEQRQAFLMLQNSRVCVVSGFPGTGKTLLVSAFVHLFEKSNINYVLLSPTGIAAKRLSQVTGKPASTIHRSLCYQKDGSWKFDSSNKFHVDAVIVDEMSMVDGSTFFHLISSLPSTTIVILVGDSAQLPSVGAGYVLNNLMKCPSVPNVSLTRIYRQEKQSDIISVAHSVLRGTPVDTSFNKDSEFLFFGFKREHVLDEICKIATALKNRHSNFQVIAPMYDGDLGVNNLNRKLREVLNSDYISGKASKLKHGDVDLYEGDRVMVIKNDYDRAIFNGDVGKITRISTKNDEIEVKVFDWFDQESNIPRYVDKIFSFKIEEARHVLKVAYACTTHKCVSPDTIVETPDGLVRIKDIAPSGVISTPHGSASYRSKVVNPAGEMLRVTTCDGYIIEMTPDHGIDVWDYRLGHTRRTADSLHEGDVLSLRLGSEWGDQEMRKLPHPFHGRLDEIICRIPAILDFKVAEFLGLLISCGTIHDGGFRFIKDSVNMVCRFTELCRELFWIEARPIVHEGVNGVEIDSTYLVRWLTNIDGLSSNDKYVPSLILSSSLAVQAGFLRGLFEDLDVNSDHIELVTRHEKLFRDVKIMLLRHGVVSGYGNYREKLIDGSVHDYRTIKIHGLHFRLFVQSITFSDKWERDGALSFHHSAISKIERFECESMCVEVPDGHRFIQNGFCGWNCQGQEFDYVLMPMTMQYGMMLYRNLIYTAITRAKKKVFILGDPVAFSYAISNDRETVRNSNLNSLISESIKLNQKNS